MLQVQYLSIEHELVSTALVLKLTYHVVFGSISSVPLSITGATSAGVVVTPKSNRCATLWVKIFTYSPKHRLLAGSLATRTESGVLAMGSFPLSHSLSWSQSQQWVDTDFWWNMPKTTLSREFLSIFKSGSFPYICCCVASSILKYWTWAG